MNRSKGLWLQVLGLVILLAGSGCVVIKPVTAWRQERRNRQAQALLGEATTGSDGKPFFTNESQASTDQLDDRILKLRRAMELDPALTETHYWIGQYGLDRLEMPGASNSLISAEACMAELKTYIQQTPNDGKSYDYGTMFGMGIRTPGVLREKAWRALITGYFRFRCLRIWTPPNELPRVELIPADSEPAIDQYRQRCDELVRLVTAYLREPPKKRMGTTHVVMLPFVYISQALRDEPQRIIDWCRLMEDVYGPDYASYSVLNPVSTAANYLDSMGHTNLAREVRESPDGRHGHEKGKATVSPPNNKAPPFIDNVPDEDANWHPKIYGFGLPEESLESVEDIPPGAGLVQIHARVGRTRYLAMGDPGQGVLSGQRDHYARRLFRQDIATGKCKEIVLKSPNGPVFISSIVSQEPYVWFSTLDGIVRYAPRTRRLKWVEKTEGFPGLILAGTKAEGSLWFAGVARNGRLFVVRVDPETFAVHVFPPGTLINGVAGLSWLGGRLLIRMNYYSFVMDPDSGACRNLPFQAVSPVAECAGASWVITGRGLEKIVDPEKPTAVLIARFGLVKASAQLDYLLPDTGVRPRHLTPASGIGLVSDGTRLWMALGEHLVAYEPERNVWTGPFVLTQTGGSAPLFIEDGTLWSVVSWNKQKGKPVVLLKIAALLAEAQKGTIPDRRSE